MDSDPAPERVHDLRTSARRFEAAFGALALDGAGVPKSVLKDLARLRKRAGKIRDMDVLTEFTAAVRPKGEEKCRVQLLEQARIANEETLDEFFRTELSSLQ